MPPHISITIPTYNRADLLDYCLTNLITPVRECGKTVEIVVSDNGSPDHTQDVLERHRETFPLLRSYRFPENRGALANWLNVLNKAEGDILINMADDDSLIVDNLMQHVDRLDREEDLVAIFADWVAWDDQAGQELHRHYSGLEEFISFGPAQPLEFVNFMLKRFYPPEIGIYRRSALLRVQTFHGRALPYYTRMHQLSRLGRVAFDPLPFYREHRVLKDRFKRTHWMNMDNQFHMIGEELRLALEAMVLLGVQDAGVTYLPADQAPAVRDSIERILHGRLRLEVDRACGRKDWITAVELRRRQVLWHGPGSDQDMQNDVLKIVLPAAMQAASRMFEGLLGSPGISLRGFESGRIAEFFATYFPETPLLPPGASADGGALILHRDERTLAGDGAPGDPARVMVLEQQLDLYRIGKAKIELKGF